MSVKHQFQQLCNDLQIRFLLRIPCEKKDKIIISIENGFTSPNLATTITEETLQYKQPDLQPWLLSGKATCSRVAERTRNCSGQQFKPLFCLSFCSSTYTPQLLICLSQGTAKYCGHTLKEADYKIYELEGAKF